MALPLGEKIAMIGDGHREHAAPRRLTHQFRDVAGAVQQAVIGMQMKMNEARYSHAASL